MRETVAANSAAGPPPPHPPHPPIRKHVPGGVQRAIVQLPCAPRARRVDPGQREEGALKERQGGRKHSRKHVSRGRMWAAL